MNMMMILLKIFPVLSVIQVEVLNQHHISGGFPLLLRLLELLRQIELLYLLLQGVKQLETAVSAVRKIQMMLNVRKIQMLTVRKIPVVSTNRAFPSPGGLQKTPRPCSRPQ
jgi:hypothetical protein